MQWFIIVYRFSFSTAKLSELSEGLAPSYFIVNEIKCIHPKKCFVVVSHGLTWPTMKITNAQTL